MRISAIIQKVAGDVESKPVAGQQSAVPLQKLPLPVLQAQLSSDKSTLVWAVVFKADSDTNALKEGTAELRERISQQAGGENLFEASTTDASVLSARLTGPAGIAVDATELFSSADVSLLLATVLLVLIFLLAIYRSPVLALIPLVAVGFAYGLTGPILGFMASKDWIQIDAQGNSIMTVLLFGAGTDYCLFLISRYRHLLTEQSSKSRALLLAVSGSSGAIAMSGLTVVIALLTLLLAKYGGVHRFAAPFSISIFIMALSSLTLVPALLAILGRGSFWPFIPRTQEMAEERARRKGKPAPKAKIRRNAGAVGRLVVGHPWKVAVSAIVVLGALATISSQVKFTFDILSSFPANMESRQGFDLIGQQFSEGKLAPVSVMADTEGKTTDLADELKKQPYVASVSEPKQGSSNAAIVSYSVELKENPYSLQAMNRIPELRQLAESSLQKAGVGSPGDKVWIGGQTAVQYDTQVTDDRDNRVIIPVVIGLIALLLLVYLRSIVAMVYLVGTVILSYFSALGIGWLVLHQFMGINAIQGAIPLYSFVFLVALGEDYNIFMISSIWEKRKHMPLRQAIAEGVSETGPVITSAGLILAGTFAVLATLPIQVLLQFGLITALGVLLDTFIVRPFLVPAITAILGRYSFWPSKLFRLKEDELPQGGHLGAADRAAASPSGDRPSGSM